MRKGEGVRSLPRESDTESGPGVRPCGGQAWCVQEGGGLCHRTGMSKGKRR